MSIRTKALAWCIRESTKRSDTQCSSAASSSRWEPACLQMRAGILARLINLAVLPIYRLVEDRRCKEVFGGVYRTYATSVGAFVPRLEFSGKPNDG